MLAIDVLSAVVLQGLRRVIAIAAFASSPPARRALPVDPMLALRHE